MAAARFLLPNIAMPSHEHELIAKLFLEDPGMVIDLLRDSLGVAIPADAVAQVDEAGLSEAAPASFQADRVILLKHASGELVLAVVVEVQRASDPEKTWSWPAYLALARRRHRCLSAVLVIATEEATAAWARRPIALDPATPWAPYVVGPELVPRIDDPEVVKTRPNLGILSALAHRETEADITILRAVLDGLRESRIDEKMVKYLWDVIQQDMGDGARRAWEHFMQVPEGYQYQSDFAKKYYGQGMQKGREEGREEGRVETLRATLLRLSERRHLRLDAGRISRINECDDVDMLNDWIDRAATASGAHEILDDEPEA